MWRYREVIKVKWDLKGGPLIQEDWYPYMKRMRHRGKAMWRYNEKVAICKPGREALPETKPDGMLI